ncbi:MAG: hypothetical protein ABJF88_04395 [Rhodothermales bacterium]
MPDTSPEPRPKRSLSDYLTDPSARRIEWLAFLLIVAFGLFVFVATRSDLVAQVAPIPTADETAAADSAAAPEEAPLIPNSPFTLTALDVHPDRLYASYLSNAFIEAPDPAQSDVTLDDFRAQLDIYTKRQGVDDNFSIRVLDNRTGKTLEVFTLAAQRDRYEETGNANWDQVDRLRRDATNTLVRKWAARGIPKPNVAIRWGRANQVAEARDRELRTIEYEIRYARQLGLSLLMTEIGTVETFNQDWMVSPVGARSRYQMMPDILELFDINSYTLSSPGGTVQVREELSPLLSMQSAFLLVRGYANSVGHEIPGISAYHTGPGNIFHLYQTYLRANAGNANISDKNVIDAYMWGVTDGFERVRKQSSFGPHSRAYVLQAYGSLRAVEDKEIDPSETIRAEFVSVDPGASITLEALLNALQPHDARLDWGYDVTSGNLYERFRLLNPHIDLPASTGDGPVSVPAAGNVTFTATSGGDRVRFFLPYGASDVLNRIGTDVLNDDALFRFDETAFADPARNGDQTPYDRAYTQLVDDIAQFGFTGSNQRKLGALYTKMQELAEENPTQYRRAQAKIITIHRRTWMTQAFRDLSGAVANVLASRAAPSDGNAAATP